MKRNIITILAAIIWLVCVGITIWSALTLEPPCEVHEPEPVEATPAQATPEPALLSQTEPILTQEEEPEPVKSVLGEFTVTAYCSCKKCCGYWATVRPLDENGESIVYTASGTVAKQGRTIAVDPEVFEYGTEVWLDGPWGEQAFIAEDCGYGVEGKHIDIYFESHDEARTWAKQTREVWLYKQEV